MAPETEDYYDVDSGFDDEFVATIKDGKFEFDNRIQNGETLLFKMTFAVEQDDGTVKEREQFIKCGKGWETRDGGATAVREDNNAPKKFHKQSAMGQLIVGARASGAEDVMRKRGNANEVATWKGLKFRFENQARKAKIGGEDVEYSQLVPVEFLGEGGKKTASKAKETTTAAAGETSGTGGDEVEAAGNGLNKATAAKLKKLAKEVATRGGSHDDFIEEAYSAGLGEEKAAEDAIMDESGIWADAQE